MATRIIGRSWWVDFHFNKTRYRRRSPENSRSGAQSYETTLRQRLVRGDRIDTETRVQQTFASFAATWFQDYAVTNNKVSEQQSKKHILRASLVPFFGHLRVDEIGTRHIEEYKAMMVQQGLSPKTINNRLTVLRKCLMTAHDWLELKTAPPRIQWLKTPPPRTSYLAVEECELLLAHATGVVREMILVALRTGMRQGELKGLQWDSIDWLNRNLAVRHSYSDYTKSLGSPKSNRERHIPLDIDVYEILCARRRENGHVFLDSHGLPFDHYRLGAALDEACARAGVRRITWHVLRHTFASHLAMNGTPLHVVQTLLGHSSVTTTMRYAHVAPSALRSAIELANPRTAHAAGFGQQVGNRWQARQWRRSTPEAARAESQAIAPQNDGNERMVAA